MNGRFEEKGAQVLGLSADPAPSLRAWAQAMGGISYPLMSDFFPHGEVLAKYGVLNEERGMAQRSVFIIDPEGAVRQTYTYQGVRPDPADILAELEQLQAG